MPELPEVETVARLLRPRLGGARIVRTEVRWPRALGPLSRQAFARRVVGTRFDAVHRRAKYLLFDLRRRGRPAGCLVGHLRMTGRLYVGRPQPRDEAHLRVALHLADGRALRFVDVRKFGRLTHAARAEDALPALGPEPLGAAFTGAWFASALAARRRRLKPLLLDQAFVAGLGNIYVDEALFRAGLHPLRASHRVPRPRALRLHAEIRATLREAIARQGASFDRFYRTPEGRPGAYQHEFRVYGRTGRPCPVCGRPIRRLVVAQRGTHVCTRCQPAPRPRRAALPR